MILICVPFHNVEKDIFHKSIKSLLKQSYSGDYMILIVTDGCTPDAREVLGFDHPKIQYYTINENRGRYFIDAVVSQANPYDFYMPSDADDISSYDRLYHLITKQAKTDADAVFHYQTVHTRTGKVIHETMPLIGQTQDATLKHLSHMSGLYKSDIVKNISFSADFRVGYDTLFVNLVKLTGNVQVVPRLLYTRTHRPTSLTSNRDTGFGSSYRKQATYELHRMYKSCYRNPQNIPQIIQASIKPATKKAMNREVKLLKEKMQW